MAFAAGENWETNLEKEGGRFMNPDELRRLAQEVPQRRLQEEDVRKQEELKLWTEQQWAKARQAVAELDSIVRQAASLGQFETMVYKAEAHYSGGAGPQLQQRSIYERDFFLNKHFKGCVVDILNVPDYAQHVFNSCPSNLNPRWVGVKGYASFHGGAYDRIELHVNW